MNSGNRADRLSPAAEERLARHVDLYADRILAQAEELNRDDILTTRDIEDALSGIDAPRRLSEESLYLSDRLSRQTDISDWYVLLSAFFALASAALALFWLGTAEQEVAALWVGGISILAAVFALSASVFRIFKRRRARALMLQLVERDAQAQYVRPLEMDLLPKARIREIDATEQTPFALRYMRQWSRIETKLRHLFQIARNFSDEFVEDYPIGGILRDLTSLKVINENRSDYLREVMEVRNQLAHGKHVPDEVLQWGIGLMDELENLLDREAENLHGA